MEEKLLSLLVFQSLYQKPDKKVLFFNTNFQNSFRDLLHKTILGSETLLH